MANLYPNGRQQYFGSDGNPLIGGKLYTYEVGTTTKKKTWADMAESVENTNPVILDANGSALIYMRGTYKLELHDASDNLIWVTQSISDTSLISTQVKTFTSVPAGIGGTAEGELFGVAGALSIPIYLHGPHEVASLYSEGQPTSLGMSNIVAGETAARIAGDAQLAQQMSNIVAGETAARIAGDAQLTQQMSNIAASFSVVDWAPGQIYGPGTIGSVTDRRSITLQGGVWYIAAVSHIAGATFADDYAAGKWIATDAVQLAGDLLGIGAGKGGNIVGFNWAILPTEINNIDWGVKTATTGYNILRSIPPAEWAGIAAGTSTFNCTPWIQSAVDAHLDIYFPPGRYWCSTSRVNLRAGSFMHGAGGANSVIVRAFDVASGVGSLYGSEGVFTAQSSSSSSYVDNVTIQNLGFLGLNQTQGYNAFCHLVALSGTRNAKVINCHFTAFRGDGLYVGSGNIGSIERHNENLLVSGCVFDGVDNYNRNGISCIDVDGANIIYNLFKNIGGAAGLATAVGAIDFERDTPGRNYNNTRATNIVGNRFFNCSKTNTAAITIFSTDRSSGASTVGHINVSDNWIEKCFWGIVVGGLSLKDSNAEQEFVKIEFNTIKNTVRSLRLNGSGITATNNQITSDPAGSTTYPGQIDIGLPVAALGKTYDVKLLNNKFRWVGFGGDACISIGDCAGLQVIGNNFEDVYAGFHFRSGTTELASRRLSGLKFIDNTFNNRGRFTGGLTTIQVFRQNTTLNTSGTNQLINSGCEWRGNIVNHAIPMVSGGHNPTQFPEMNRAVPDTGTWDVGNRVRLTTVSAGSFESVCSVGGTFGTLSSVMADATNGSATLSNVVDTNNVLREGHYITVVDSATRRKILCVVGSTVYLDGNFTGTTGTGLAISWTPPTFVAV